MMFAANKKMVRLAAGLTGVAVALTAVLSGTPGYAQKPQPPLADAAEAALHTLKGASDLGRATSRTATDGLNFGDLTGDGKADLAAIDDAGRLWVYPGKALVYSGVGPRDTSYFSPRFQAGEGWSFTALVRHGDWNNDGKQDLLRRDGSGRLFLYAGTGTTPRVLQNGIQVGEGWNTYEDLVGIGDADGDGFDDLMARGSGRLVIYFGTGVATAPFRRSTATGGSGWNGDLLTSVGDWSGDGRSDFLFRKSDDEVWLYRAGVSGFPANDPVQLFDSSDGGLLVDAVGMGNLTSDADQPTLPDLLFTDSDGFLYALALDTGADFNPLIGQGWVPYILF
jgi:VCBS repeat protein